MKRSFVLQQAIEDCEKQIAAIVKTKFGFSGFTAKVEVSKEFGDLAFACFPLAAKAKKNPNEIAQTIAEEFNAHAPKSKFFEKAEPLNGFVNFFFKDSFYAEVLDEGVEKKFGESTEGKGKTFVIEFSQPNVGKPFHVGHIRSTILGDAVSNLYDSQGWKTIRMNYIGDSGTQVAKLLLAMEIYKDLPKIENEKHMLEYYVRINKEIESRPELTEKARMLLEKIEAGDKGVMEKIRFIREKSYEAFQKNYDLLEIKFDIIIGESEFIEEGKKTVEEALKKKIAFVDKGGETVVKLEPELPNFIVLRSNGTTLYATRDLALAAFKHKKYSFDRSLILTASEQNLHFRQVIKTLELLGRDYAKNYKHLGFGLISLPEGKLSTREGRVVFLEDVINEMINAAKHELEAMGHHAHEMSAHRVSRTMDYTKKDKMEIAKTVGIGSLKFEVLRITPEKNITFDPKKAVSFQGDTGAYVQYTCVRAKSVLDKAGGKIPKVKSGIAFNAEETKVSKLLAQFPLVLKNSCKAMQPHQLCDYLLRLSAEFNAFYHAHSVLKADSEGEKAKRLALVKATANVLEKGLGILGISVPEKM